MKKRKVNKITAQLRADINSYITLDMPNVKIIYPEFDVPQTVDEYMKFKAKYPIEKKLTFDVETGELKVLDSKDSTNRQVWDGIYKEGFFCNKKVA